MRRARILVTEPERDDRDVDTGLEEVHRGRVAHAMRRNAQCFQAGMILRCQGRR